MTLIVGSPGPDGSPVMQTYKVNADAWRSEGAWRIATWTLPVPAQGAFVRARGSNTHEATPQADVPGEDPWQDLWFHSNPVFVEAERAGDASR